MQPDGQVPNDRERPVVGERVGSVSEVSRLRARCRRQALAIATLRDAASTLQRGAAALKADNAALRAENARMRERADSDGHMVGRSNGMAPIEVSLPLDVRAPGAARIVVERCLGGRVEPAALESARLLVSELVTNSVRHSGGSAADSVTVRVRLTPSRLGLEIEDGGNGGPISPQTPDPETGAGLGLNLVRTVSERWGVERVADGRTRVWAQIAAYVRPNEGFAVAQSPL
jgi:anti-sigma regulatory factor (Ser/Thr protein kinase)